MGTNVKLNKMRNTEKLKKTISLYPNHFIHSQ